MTEKEYTEVVVDVRKSPTNGALEGTLEQKFNAVKEHLKAGGAATITICSYGQQIFHMVLDKKGNGGNSGGELIVKIYDSIIEIGFKHPSKKSVRTTVASISGAISATYVLQDL